MNEHFEKYGKILSSKVDYDKNGNSRCFGFLSYENDEHGKTAIKELNGTRIEGELEDLYVGVFEKKSERFRKLKNENGKADPNNKRNL